MTSKEALEKIKKGYIVINGKLTKIKDTNVYYYIAKDIEKLEELKRDVARYFELNAQAREKWGKGIDDKEAHKYTQLHIKLSKVGKKDV